MQLATWNVNSLKVRLPHVIAWLETHPVDVLALQETKLCDEKFPIEALAAVGYRSLFVGQRTYNGVALLVREGALIDETNVVRQLPGFITDQQRLIAATVNGVRVISAYFPNGQAPASEKFVYKMQWLAALQDWLKNEVREHPQLALLGDFNIAPEDRDVHNPEAWIGQNLVSPEERAVFMQLTALGLVDVFRQFEQPNDLYSWWDYRQGAFRRNAGLRIDHTLLSPAIASTCVRCEIDKTPRSWTQPSDHAPVIAEFSI